MGASLVSVMVLSASVLGHHHGKKAECCATCGVESAALAADLVQLQTCPGWHERERAAHRLRQADWRCHPEVVAALVNAMLHDCHPEVREESAESLAKMAPCVAPAHEALQLAATADPDHETRREARKGLKRLGKRCEGPCVVCEPGATVVVPGPATVVPGPATVVPGPVEVVPGPSVPSTVVPPSVSDEPVLTPIEPPTSNTPSSVPSTVLPPMNGPRVEPEADSPPAAPPFSSVPPRREKPEPEKDRPRMRQSRLFERLPFNPLRLGRNRDRDRDRDRD